MDAASMIADLPRVALGHWPTPLEPCDRLHEVTGGSHVWIKRDDCSGLAVGGNKTRKLEFLMGRALAEGSTGVVTFGALQSNHARQTAAAAARLGMTCDLVLARAVPRDGDHYLHSGNLLLDRLLGATVHVVDDPDAAFVRFAELMDEAERSGRRLFGIGPGGSEPLGVLGYVAATLELADQLRQSRLVADRIVVAASTSGTAAGIILGAVAASLDVVVDVVCVYEPAEVTSEQLGGLIARTSEEFGLVAPSPDRWRVTDAALGEGYGIPTAAGLEAIDLLARTEGILLDPVYTSKAFAHPLEQLGAEGGAEPDPEGVTVFVHTGGSPGLFAYADDLDRRVRRR
jgi:D-cysteine desulfhydrase family pyridoxal phosphate-dependent enzyme